MNVKVIIRDGIVESVLQDSEEPLNTEIVDICKDYADSEQLDAYIDKLYSDPSFSSVEFTIARFSEDEEDAAGDSQDQHRAAGESMA